MAADVSSLATLLSGYKEEGEGKRDLVTRDLLGGGGAVLRSEVDLELRIPGGWERRLDLLSGRTYLRKRDSNMLPHHGDGLNLALLAPPPTALVPDPDASARVSAAPTSAYQSVCTLEKVKSALERAVRKERPLVASHLSTSPPSSSITSSSITTSSSIKRRADEGGHGPNSPQGLGRAEAEEMAVAGCPACLLYVLVSTADPKCPRCATHVPVNGEPKKRPKFDLNSPTQDDDDSESN